MGIFFDAIQNFWFLNHVLRITWLLYQNTKKKSVQWDKKTMDLK